MTRLRLAVLLAVLSIAALITGIAITPVPYVNLSPGPMYNTIGEYHGTELITIIGRRTYPVSGTLDLVTVNERGGPFGGLTLPEAVAGVLDPDVSVVPEALLYPPGTTAGEAEEENAAEFSTSQSAAIAAALSHLKIPVTVKVLVSSVVSGGPAQGKLRVGDEVVAIDGKAVTTPSSVPELVQKRPPGSTVIFTVRRSGSKTSVPLVSVPRPHDPGKAYVGITVSATYSGPFLITFGLEEVGGPSAGMMFSLGIIDKLTPGELNGGRKVAGTGTISPEGAVGAIGGIKQKMAAARDQGMQIFLAPEGNCGEVRSQAPPELNVAKVGTLTDAVTVLKTWLAGDNAAIPRC